MGLMVLYAVSVSIHVDGDTRLFRDDGLHDLLHARGIQVDETDGPGESDIAPILLPIHDQHCHK